MNFISVSREEVKLAAGPDTRFLSKTKSQSKEILQIVDADKSAVKEANVIDEAALSVE